MNPLKHLLLPFTIGTAIGAGIVLLRDRFKKKDGTSVTVTETDEFVAFVPGHAIGAYHVLLNEGDDFIDVHQHDGEWKAFVISATLGEEDGSIHVDPKTGSLFVLKDLVFSNDIEISSRVKGPIGVAVQVKVEEEPDESNEEIVVNIDSLEEDAEGVANE